MVGPYGISGRRWVDLVPHVLPLTDGDPPLAVGAGLPATGGPETFTNVQEAGVDEPDLAKTDGRRLVTISDRKLQVVDLGGGTPVRLGQVEVGGWGGQLLLAGDRAVVLSHGDFEAPTAGNHWLSRARTDIAVVDISAPASPALVARLRIEGSHVAARMVDGLVRVVVHSSPSGPAFEAPTSAADQARSTEANRRAIQASQPADWLPHYRLERPGHPSVDGLLTECADVVHPEPFAGLSTVSVLTLDPADPRPAQTACVLGAGSNVYASRESLYVATTTWTDPAQQAPTGPYTTQLHRFAIGGRQPARFVASGEVPGFLLDQFSMSEHAGHLRVASTMQSPIAAGTAAPANQSSESAVTMLALTSPMMTKVGAVRGLGKGETIQAVRFAGDVGYVVTFRQVDPLYVLDLRNPSQPALRGELKVPGYSSYLHPISESLLIGVGQDATEEGRPLGTQVSVFDVSDPAAPVRRHLATLPDAWSEAEHDHHAFLWWPATQQLVLPLSAPGPDPDGPFFSGAVAWRWDQAGGFADETRLQHPVAEARIQRSFVVGDALYTVSGAGVMSSDLQTLAQRGWAAFD